MIQLATGSTIHTSEYRSDDLNRLVNEFELLSNQIIQLPKGSWAFNSIPMVLNLIGQVENDGALARALENLPYFKEEPDVVKQSLSDNFRLRENDIYSDLQQLPNFMLEHPELKTYVVVLKILLSMFESNPIPASALFVSNEQLLGYRLQNIPTKEDLDSILDKNVRKERATLFVGSPRILVLSGSPDRLKRFEARGLGLGIVNGLMIKPKTGKYYFEITLPSEGSGCRLGWARFDLLDAVENIESLRERSALGSDKRTWGFDPVTKRYYHEATKRLRRLEGGILPEFEASLGTESISSLLHTAMSDVPRCAEEKTAGTAEAPLHLSKPSGATTTAADQQGENLESGQVIVDDEKNVSVELEEKEKSAETSHSRLMSSSEAILQLSREAVEKAIERIERSSALLHVPVSIAGVESWGDVSVVGGTAEASQEKASSVTAERGCFTPSEAKVAEKEVFDLNQERGRGGEEEELKIRGEPLPHTPSPVRSAAERASETLISLREMGEAAVALRERLSDSTPPLGVLDDDVEPRTRDRTGTGTGSHTTELGTNLTGNEPSLSSPSHASPSAGRVTAELSTHQEARRALSDRIGRHLDRLLGNLSSTLDVNTPSPVRVRPSEYRRGGGTESGSGYRAPVRHVSRPLDFFAGVPLVPRGRVEESARSPTAGGTGGGSAPLVAGTLIDTDNGVVQFYINGVEHFLAAPASSSDQTEESGPPAHGQLRLWERSEESGMSGEVCYVPAISCGNAESITVNIGVTGPFKYPPVLNKPTVASLQTDESSDTSVSNAAEPSAVAVIGENRSVTVLVNDSEGSAALPVGSSEGPDCLSFGEESLPQPQPQSEHLAPSTNISTGTGYVEIRNFEGIDILRHPFTIEVGAQLNASFRNKLPASACTQYTLLSYGSPFSGLAGFCLSVQRDLSLLLEMYGYGKYKTAAGVFAEDSWCQVSVCHSDAEGVRFLVDGVVVPHQRNANLYDAPSALGTAKKSVLCVGAQYVMVGESEAGESISRSPSKRPAVPTLGVSTVTASGEESQADALRGSNYWVGRICEVRVWNESRGTESIASSLGKISLNGTEHRLVGWYTFQEPSGTLVLDSSVGSQKHFNDGRIKGLVKRLRSRTNMEISGLPAAEEAVPHAIEDPNVEKVKSGSVLDIVEALSSSISHSCANFLDAPPSVRVVQRKLTLLKTIEDPKVMHYLLLNSLLRQLMRISVSARSKFQSAHQHAIHQAVIAVLQLLRVNLLAIAELKISPAALGLKYSANTEAGGQSKSFVSNLLISVFYTMVQENFSPALDGLDQERRNEIVIEAVEVVRAGLVVFFPHVSDRILLVECLILRRHYESNRCPTSDHSTELLRMLRQTAEKGVIKLAPGGGPFETDPLVVLLSLSGDASTLLLDAVTYAISAEPYLSEILPLRIRPVATRSANQLDFPRINKEDYLSWCNVDTPPEVGVWVERGPHWQYGDQDGGSGSVGVVIGVSDWLGQEQRRLIVRWSNGYLNCYRYGVSSEQSEELLYDLGMLRKIEKLSVPVLAHVHTATSEGEGGDADGGKEELKTASSSSSSSSGLKRTFSDLPLPADIRRSLTENQGANTKRNVLRSIKALASVEWLQERQLVLAENTLLNKLTVEEICVLYEAFYQHFALHRYSPLRANQSSTTSEEQESVVSTSFIKLLLCEVEEVSKKGVSDGGEWKTTGPLALLLAIQAALDGSLGTIFESRKDYRKMKIPISSQRLCNAPFTSRSAMVLQWDWNDGIWGTLPAEGYSESLPTADFDGKRSSAPVRIHSNLTFDLGSGGDSLSVSTSGRMVRQTAGRQWSTCFGSKAMLPDTGIHKWYVMVSNLSKRGHCIIGIATKSQTQKNFLGHGEYGWGLTSNKELFHSGNRTNADFGSKLVAGSVVEVCLNTDTGTLSFSTSHGEQGNSDATLTQAFEGLHGHVLYPAFSLFSCGDSLTLLPDKFSGQVGHGEITESLLCPLGGPSPELVRYAKLLFTSCDHLLLNSSDRSIMTHPLLSVCLPQLISRLLYYPLPPGYEVLASDRVGGRVRGKFDIEVHLRRLLETCSDRLEDQDQSAIATKLCRQLTCIIATYLGALVCSDINFNPAGIGNMLLKKEASPDHELGLVETQHNLKTKDSDSSGHTIWLTSELLSNGLTSSGLIGQEDGSKSDVLVELLQAQLEGGDSLDLLIQWVTKSDMTSSTVRRIGGPSLTRCVQQTFVCILYHAGYSLAVETIIQQLVESKALNKHDDTKHSLDTKPPQFLLLAWGYAEGIRLWCRQICQDEGASYERLAAKLSRRCSFLFKVAPCRSGSLRAVTETGTGPAMLREMDKHLKRISDLVLGFLKDSCDTATLWLELRLGLLRSERRVNSFKTLVSILSTKNLLGSTASKCGFLLRLPGAMRGQRVNLLTSSSYEREVGESEGSGVLAMAPPKGHYLNGIYGCSESTRRALYGGFNMLYACLASELSAANESVD